MQEAKVDEKWKYVIVAIVRYFVCRYLFIQNL